MEEGTTQLPVMRVMGLSREVTSAEPSYGHMGSSSKSRPVGAEGKWAHLHSAMSRHTHTSSTPVSVFEPDQACEPGSHPHSHCADAEVQVTGTWSPSPLLPPHRHP